MYLVADVYVCKSRSELYSNKYIMEYLMSLLLMYTGNVFTRIYNILNHSNVNDHLDHSRATLCA